MTGNGKNGKQVQEAQGEQAEVAQLRERNEHQRIIIADLQREREQLRQVVATLEAAVDRQQDVPELVESCATMQAAILRLAEELAEAGMNAREAERKIAAREAEAVRWQTYARRLEQERDARPTEDDVEDVRIELRNLQAELFSLYRAQGRI